MQSILKYNKKEFTEILLKDNFLNISKAYRINQILNWIYKKFIFSFDNMSDLPKDLRDYLKKNFFINSLEIENIIKSSDNEATKYLFKTLKKDYIEAVRIEHPNRNSVCLSTMTGCPLDCKFCATGKLKNFRNLEKDEIISQIILLYKEKPFQNIVFMGMGEPLLNCYNLFGAIDNISNNELMNFSSRRITISTSGIIEGISKLINFYKKINLAVSLNSPFQKEREILMPICKSNPLNELFKILKIYNNECGRFTFEYVVLPGINNTKKHADEIIKLKKMLNFNINLIRFNDFNNCSFKKCSREELNKFLAFFKNSKIEIVERLSKGSDIFAGCGQLVGNFTF